MKPVFLAFAFVLASRNDAVAATVRIWEEVPYLSELDSPFYEGIQAGTIFLEDFEDQDLNTPHVTSWDYPRVVGIGPRGPELSRQQGRSFRALGNTLNVFSVDGDDGLNDGFLGLSGNTWTTLDVITGQLYGRMEFRFQRDAEGRLPTYVGFVITDVLYPDYEVEIGAWDAGILEMPTNNWWNENTYDARTWRPFDHYGDTRSHRFFGIYSDTGIMSIVIDNVKQLDHLQYGYAIPEPGAGVLCVLVAFSLLRRRARR